MGADGKSSGLPDTPGPMRCIETSPIGTSSSGSVCDGEIGDIAGTLIGGSELWVVMPGDSGSRRSSTDSEEGPATALSVALVEMLDGCDFSRSPKIQIW